jgi:UDP-N-acetylmuramate--alanine ligase
MGMEYKRVWAIFQPFTFSRTSMLLDDFVTALSIPDKTVLTAIMGSREKNTYHIYSKDLGEKIDGCVWFDKNPLDNCGDDVDNLKLDESNLSPHDKNFNEVCEYICENVREGDLVITLGCGDVYKVAKRVFKMLGGQKC